MGTKRTRLIALATKHARVPRPGRLVDSKPVCAFQGCQRPFTPVRPHQRFCTPKCRWAEWSATNPRVRRPRAS